MDIPYTNIYEFLGDPDSRDVRVSGEVRRLFMRFKGPTIPLDYRSYILYGYTILPNGTRIATRFEIDTRKPTLLVGEGFWYIDERWYIAFEPEALKVLGVSLEEAKPFRWTPNVPIETVEQPPYLEGQALQSRTPPTASVATALAKSCRRVRCTSSTGIDLEPGEKLLWSCQARRPRSLTAGKLYLTTRRAQFCPRSLDRLLNMRPFGAGIRELIDVGCRPVRGTALLGGEKMGLRLMLVGGGEEIFVVADLLEAVEQFSKAIHTIE